MSVLFQAVYLFSRQLCVSVNPQFLTEPQTFHSGGSPVAQTVKNPPGMQETWVPSLGWEDPLEEVKATHSNILAWRIPWTEEPGELHPWHRKELDITERLSLSTLITRRLLSLSVSLFLCRK